MSSGVGNLGCESRNQSNKCELIIQNRRLHAYFVECLIFRNYLAKVDLQIDMYMNMFKVAKWLEKCLKHHLYSSYLLKNKVTM